MSRKNKSVSFSLSDQFEQELLTYAEDKSKGMFSRYVKRLIVKDRDGHNIVSTPHVNSTSPINKTQEEKEIMSSFL